MSERIDAIRQMMNATPGETKILMTGEIIEAFECVDEHGRRGSESLFTDDQIAQMYQYHHDWSCPDSLKKI